MKSLLFVSLLMLSFGSVANNVQLSVENTDQIQTVHGARDWALSDAQWQRYQSLMQSPLTYDMKDASPLEVLAIFAKDAAERAQLAEKLVEFDKKRTDGLLALDVAYRDAWKRLYPNLPVVNSGLPSRVVLFVTEQCDACLDALKAWRSKGVSVDVYLVGAKGDDRRLRQWAADAGIRQSDVTERYITLNHDTRGLWFSFAKGQTTPVAITQRGDQWSVISHP